MAVPVISSAGDMVYQDRPPFDLAITAVEHTLNRRE
jgi:hypothetical protein